MSDAPFYSRRLTSQELDLWIDLGKDVGFNEGIDTDDPLRAQTFLELDDSMFFISYLGDDIIGGSSIYKDITRNAMALLAVRIHPSHRERVSTHIVKSSLPFFRTVAIREVDAILADDVELSRTPFPLQTELPNWTLNALEENGFTKVEDLQNLTFAIPESKWKSSVTWDSTVTSDEHIRKLFWSIYEDDRPDYAHLFLGINLSRKTKSLYTYSRNERCEIAMATQQYREKLLIQTLFYQNKSRATEIPSAIAELCSNLKLTNASICIHKERDKKLFEELASHFGEPIERRILTLMRKRL